MEILSGSFVNIKNVCGDSLDKLAMFIIWIRSINDETTFFLWANIVVSRHSGILPRQKN